MQDFESWIGVNPDDIASWKPNLNPGYLKQFITDWVVKSVDGLRNPSFRATIIKCFQHAGCFKEIRNNAEAKRIQNNLDECIEAMNRNLLQDAFQDEDENIEEIDGQGDNGLEEKQKEDDNAEEDLPEIDD